MLRDPEKPVERWKEPIYADSPGEAKEDCEERAAEYTRQNKEPVELVDVEPVSTVTRNRYNCIFES